MDAVHVLAAPPLTSDDSGSRPDDDREVLLSRRPAGRARAVALSSIRIFG